MQISFINAAAQEEHLSGNLLYGVGRSEEMLLPGQLVEAEVIFSSGESVNVRLSSGAVLRARLDTGITLAQGDNVWLAVKENDGKSLVLQLMANSNEIENPAKMLAALMAKAGLQNTRLNLSLVSLFEESTLPLEAGRIQQAANILERYPDVSMKAAAFAAANKLEISSDNLSIVEDLLRSDFKAGEMLGRIFSRLTGEAGAEIPGANQTLPTTATAGSESVQPGYKPGLDGGQLSDLAGRSGWEPIVESGTGGAEKAASTQLLKAAERTFFARIEKPEDAGVLKQTVKQLPGRLKLLKSYTGLRADNAKNAAPEIERLIGGLKLLSSIDRYACMQIPVMTGGRPSTVEVYVFNKKQGKKKINPDSSTILLALDTENMGHVQALVSIRKSSIAIRFNLENEDFANYLRERTVALYNMVSAKGHHLSGVQFQTGGEPVTPMTAPTIAKQYDSGANRKFNVCI